MPAFFTSETTSPLETPVCVHTGDALAVRSSGCSCCSAKQRGTSNGRKGAVRSESECPLGGQSGGLGSSGCSCCSAKQRGTSNGRKGAVRSESECPLGGQSGGLGTIGANCRALWKAGEFQQVMRVERKQILALQRSLSSKSGQQKCLVAPIPTADHTECVLDERGGHWRGVQTCKSKTCVHCHVKARKEMIKEADRGLHHVLQAGGSVVMLTLTCSHRGVRLKRQLIALQQVYRLVFKRRAIVRWLKEAGYVGSVRGTEIQIHIKRRQFHPHLHVALAFEREVNEEEAEELRKLIAARWCETMRKKGIFALSSQQHAELAHDSGAGQYVAKGVAEEIGSGALKKGRNGSVSWYGLLWHIYWADQDGDVEERDALIELYQEFESAVHGKRWIAVSKSLKERAALWEEEEEESEEEGELKEEPKRVIWVPLVVHRTLMDLRVVHLVPSVLSADEALAERFAELCAEERRAAELRGYESGAGALLRLELSNLFKGLVDRSVWAQNRALGLYQRGDDYGGRRASNELEGTPDDPSA